MNDLECIQVRRNGHRVKNLGSIILVLSCTCILPGSFSYKLISLSLSTYIYIYIYIIYIYIYIYIYIPASHGIDGGGAGCRERLLVY
jgi:hypothetical protein